MTLVLTVHGRDTLWLVVDRRLSYDDGRPPVDDAVKVMHLETLDGIGLLGYAGLGATSQGTQPSEWMSAALRGRGGLNFEHALRILSDAANMQLPKHLVSLRSSVHFIIVPAFVRDIGWRLYSIDYAIDRKTGQHWYRYTSHQRTAVPRSPSPRIAMGGTGGYYLDRAADAWQSALMSVVKAHDRGKISDLAVADHLARLNYEVHRRVADASVGPRCIVVWRRRPGARSGAGSGHQYYTGVARDRGTDGIGIPTISNGMDVRSVVGVVLKDVLSRVSNGRPRFDFDIDEMNRQLANLPSGPDDKLR